jgi:activator of HSP90 ATPase
MGKMWPIGIGIHASHILRYLFTRAEKNLSNAMKARVTEMLQGFQVSNGNVTIIFTEVEKVEGDMTAMNRKGKTYVLFSV